jgi:hypothetical protein
VVVTQNRPEEGEVTVTTGFVQAYPAEYFPSLPGAGSSLLQQIASITGGRNFTLGELTRGAVPLIDQEGEAAEPVELWPWFLLAALGLWPLEIAWRRWNRLRIQ